MELYSEAGFQGYEATIAEVEKCEAVRAYLNLMGAVAQKGESQSQYAGAQREVGTGTHLAFQSVLVHMSNIRNEITFRIIRHLFSTEIYKLVYL